MKASNSTPNDRKLYRLCLWIMIASCIFTVAWYDPVSVTDDPNQQMNQMPGHNQTADSSTPKLPEQPDLEENNPQAKLRDTAAKWIRTIADEHQIVPWKDADFTIEPLGPGTHAWLVHVLDQGQPVGYLIITALKDGGFRLAEYGIGERPIFHLDTLRSSLVQTGLVSSEVTLQELSKWLEVPDQKNQKSSQKTVAIDPPELIETPSTNPEIVEPQIFIERHYLYPFAVYWKVKHKELKQSFYFDAVTGEQYPLTKDPGSKTTSVPDIEYVPTQLEELKDRLQLPLFDPYEDLGWIVEQPLHIKSVSDVLDPLREKQRLTLTVELYDRTVLLPYPIIGFAHWERSEAYILISKDDVHRYVPLIDAIRYGQIYINQDEIA